MCMGNSLKINNYAKVKVIVDIHTKLLFKFYGYTKIQVFVMF